MERTVDQIQTVRLEDFITSAEDGKNVHVGIDLRKEKVVQKVHPEETEEMNDEIHMYLLVGEYTFQVEGTSRNVPKVYVIGSTGESLVAASGNKNIANQRLRMDYQRLRDAGMTFEEKYF